MPINEIPLATCAKVKSFTTPMTQYPKLRKKAKIAAHKIILLTGCLGSSWRIWYPSIKATTPIDNNIIDNKASIPYLSFVNPIIIYIITKTPCRFYKESVILVAYFANFFICSLQFYRSQLLMKHHQQDHRRCLAEQIIQLL